MNRYRTVRVGFPTRIAGIPCHVVAHITPGYPATRYEPGEPDDIELSIFDRRGYRAPWLERKLTDDDKRRIENEAFEEDAALRNPY